MVTDTGQSGTLLAGRYRLGARLGAGGMAEVFRAEDLRLGRAVAVKMVRADAAADPALPHRLEREAAAAARLSHPNVVSVFDVGDDDGRPFLVMELIEGGTLADRLEEGPLDQERARQVALDVLAALEAAHGAGVLHRDIKPANILFTAGGTAKLADFGIAKALDGGPTDHDLTRPNVVMGTARYLPPERALGSEATVGSDLWSVALVLHEALGGGRPQLDLTGMGGLTDAGPPVPPVASFRPGIDPRIDAVIGRALRPRPADRFPSAAAMAAALREEPTVVTAPLVAPAPVGTLTRERLRSVPTAMKAGTVMLVVAGLALVASLAAGGSPAHSAASAPPPAPKAETAIAKVVAAPVTTVCPQHKHGPDNRTACPPPTAPSGNSGPGSQSGN